ncbi:MAG TPA: hypothetical protein VMU94_10480 [Streptosporangiaceae bacterium]|nr:hypothetical protein [Streptosporangiaceae bacterium]
MSNGKYRSVFHSPMPPADAFRAARDEMRAWLRTKKYDLGAFDRGDPRIGPGVVLLRNAANAADGSQTERWQLRESKDDGAWMSSLTVHAPAHPVAAGNAATWFWVEIEFVPKSLESEAVSHVRASVPRLARGLLTAAPAYDSLAALTGEPVLIGRERVDELIDILCDPDRRYPAVVASPHPDIAFEDWRATITRVMWYLPGLASIYILDPLAEQAFVEGIGDTHAVWGGALRTYLPDVDPAVADEAARHRLLSPARIAADPGRAAGTVSVLPRRLAAETPLPAPLTGVNRTLLTREREAPETTDVEGRRSQVTQLAEDRDVALNLAEKEEDRANTLFTERENALAELAEREQRVLYLDSQVRALQRRLVAIGRPEDAFQPAEEPAAPPATFADLLDWLETDLSQVVFTGDATAAVNLDQRPEASTWVRSSWEILQALETYAATKISNGFPGDFKTWCESSPSGEYTIPAGKVARDESETVRNNAKWRREREFPVPIEIDPSRNVFMGAHVRIGASAGGQISPRLHFYDCTAQTGLIYVGYLGRHLTNTRT